MLRLYYNCSSDRPWSIDSGAGTEEKTFASVEVYDYGLSCFDARHVGSETYAAAWIQFDNAKLSEKDHVGYIDPVPGV